ncbi:hypothetical protein HYQ45_012554 [Verticillium longisporum]|uniref:Uncharacterized protein n=1 Tax=Verticillium longisporum TaxID=100787 RepID=A0A0G4NI55_VERLO|nr:hypothetical protein HYQ44_003421 [Verticillium longisporum]KAG7127513.1 hypothetical protein HYQ45_012554 [Verticillium longisporum]CRK46172.1 hypothetical protein BN1723_006903 [Verticillium longisporum]
MDDTSSSQTTMDPSTPTPKRRPPLYTPLAAATLERINTWRTTNLLAATCTCTDPPTPLPHPTSTFLAAHTNFWHGTWTYRRHPPPPPPDDDWRPDSCPRCARLGAAAPATPDPTPEQQQQPPHASASATSSSVGAALSRIASLCLTPAKKRAAAKPGAGSGSSKRGGPDAAKPGSPHDPDTEDDDDEVDKRQGGRDGGAPLKQQASSSSLFRRIRLRKWSFERTPAKTGAANASRAGTPSERRKTPRVTAAAVAAVSAPAERVGSEYNPSSASTGSNPDDAGLEGLKVKRAREGDARLSRARELLERKERAERQGV